MLGKWEVREGRAGIDESEPEVADQMEKETVKLEKGGNS